MPKVQLIRTPGYNPESRHLPPRLRAHEVPEGLTAWSCVTGREFVIAERAMGVVYAWEVRSGKEALLHPNIVLATVEPKPARGES